MVTGMGSSQMVRNATEMSNAGCSGLCMLSLFLILGFCVYKSLVCLYLGCMLAIINQAGAKKGK